MLPLDDDGAGSGAGDSGSAEPVGGAAFASTFAPSDEDFSSDGGERPSDDEGAADAQRRAAAAAGGEAGWGVDTRGRPVFHTGLSRSSGRDRLSIARVLVEYAPGARIPRHDGEGEGRGSHHAFVG